MYKKFHLKSALGNFILKVLGDVNFVVSILLVYEADINSTQLVSTCKEFALTAYRKPLSGSNLRSWQSISRSTFIEPRVLYNVRKNPTIKPYQEADKSI